MDTWVVVADGSHARVFSSDAELTELVVAKEFKNNHHGSTHGGIGARGRDGAHHTEEAKFAHDLAAEVARAVTAHEVRDVVLVAPSRFLGDLTAALPKPVLAHVTAKIGKDFTKVERHELAKRLKAALAESHDAH